MGAEKEKVTFIALEYCWKCDSNYSRSSGCNCQELDRKYQMIRFCKVMKEEGINEIV